MNQIERDSPVPRVLRIIANRLETQKDKNTTHLTLPKAEEIAHYIQCDPALIQRILNAIAP